MDEPLHPSSLSEILDRTAQIYRERFLVFLGIAVVPTAVLLAGAGVVILAALRLGPNGAAPASTVKAAILGVTLVAGLLLVALPALLGATSLATAAVSHAAARTFFGQSITIRDSYKAVWRRGWRYVGLFVFEILVIWVVPFGAWFVAILLSAGLGAVLQSSGMGDAGALLFLAGLLVVAALVTYGFWMALRLSLAFPACVVEQIGAWDAVRRSSTLTRGTRGRILLLYLLGVALSWLLSLAITIPLAILIALLTGPNTPQHAQTTGMITIFVIYGAGFAVQALTRPVYGIALILFYYDQRIRQEGFDIEWMMLRAGLVVPQAPQPETAWQPVAATASEPPETPPETPAEPAGNAAPESTNPGHAEQTPASDTTDLGETS